MTKKEIMDRIEKLEDSRFYLSMKDHWIGEDYTDDARLCGEISRLKRELEQMEE